MKKIILQLPLYFVAINAFSQQIIFQDNFEKGRSNEAWRFPTSQCAVINLESKGIRPSPAGNNFALACAGNADIMIDIPVDNTGFAVMTQFSFDYWITNKNAKLTVNILFLKANGDIVSSVGPASLSEKPGWDLFNPQLKIPGGSSVMRLKLIARAPGVAGETIYFQSVCLGCTRKR